GGIAVGGVAGFYGARVVKMTAMPQMVALFNGAGGGAAALVAFLEFARSFQGYPVELGPTIATFLGLIIGAVSFSGSAIAFGKLQGVITPRAFRYPGQQAVTGLLVLAMVLLAAAILLSGRTGVFAVAPGAAHVEGHEPLARERPLRRVRRGHDRWRDRGRRRRRRPVDPLHQRRGRRDPPRLRAERHRGPRVRPRGRAGAAQRARARGRPREQGHQRALRDTSRGRADAGAHERAPRRGERPVREALRPGADQPRIPARGRGARHRRDRPHAPRRSLEPRP